MKVYKLALLPGDGIGPEVVEQGLKVLNATKERFGFGLEIKEAVFGGAAIDKFGHPLPQSTLKICQDSGAVLLGAVGGPKWDQIPVDLRPEKGLLGLRKQLGLYANLRPVNLPSSLAAISPLKDELVKRGLDLIIVRELTGGLYFGQPRNRFAGPKGREAVDTLSYTEEEIRRIVDLSFQVARGRRKKLTSVDKANVLESSRLWREITNELAKDYPEVELEHMYVDNCAMQLVRNPAQFDVIVTENMFGDILSDQAAMIGGSLGLLPSASLGTGKTSLYEPAHGSAPDIAGQGKANPIATILSCAMLLRLSYGEEEAAEAVEKAVNLVLDEGWRTADLVEQGKKYISTDEMGNKIAEKIAHL
jgi:3-isopropylmalate dehydrogenase